MDSSIKKHALRRVAIRLIISTAIGNQLKLEEYMKRKQTLQERGLIFEFFSLFS
jgi:hypothetical protein